MAAKALAAGEGDGSPDDGYTEGLAVVGRADGGIDGRSEVGSADGQTEGITLEGAADGGIDGRSDESPDERVMWGIVGLD